MIKKISLHDFRIFSDLELNVNSRLVIFVGRNAIGKTSILEAIYLASTSKSHRTNNYHELIKHDQANALIKIEANKELKVVLTPTKKNYFINNRETRNIDFLGNLKTIMFSSQDLKIVAGSKVDRRKFMDINITLLDARYLDLMLNYKKILKKRNEILKFSNPDLKLIKVLTTEMANYVLSINKYRNLFCQRINEYLIEITKSMGLEKICLKYDFCLDLPTIIARYTKNFATDCKYKNTTYGPHKEDFEIEINDVDAKLYASAGQQRTVAICLKLAMALLLEKDTKNEPILLLDDIFAELDNKRQEALVKYLNKNQTFITTTSLIEIPNNLLEQALLIKLEERK